MKNLNLGTHIPKTPSLLFTCLLVAATVLSTNLSAQTTLCVGGTSQISYSGSGGSWVSGNTAVATVNSTGLVTAVGAGSTTVNYQTSSSTNTSLYWTFESGSSNPSGGFTVTRQQRLPMHHYCQGFSPKQVVVLMKTFHGHLDLQVGFQYKGRTLRNIHTSNLRQAVQRLLRP